MVRRHYTPDLANKSLPLVRRIAHDVREVAQRIREVWPRAQAKPQDDDLQQQLDELREQFGELIAELRELGIELKDPHTGLLDFRAKRDGREVYLCWRLGEDAVDHWHALEGGFAGRRPIDEF